LVKFNWKEWSFKALALILSLASLIVILYVRFSNPDLTETRLFLTFWPLWLIIIIALLLACALWRLALGMVEF